MGVLCMRGSCIPGIALLFCSGLGLADEPGRSIASSLDDVPAMESMEVIVVTGEQPGPGLWKVSSGNHVMWILGEVSPFPRKVKWKLGQNRKPEQLQKLIGELRQRGRATDAAAADALQWSLDWNAAK